METSNQSENKKKQIFERSDGSPIVFDVVFLNDDDLKILKFVIEENGGKIHTKYRRGTIKFTHKANGLTTVAPDEKFYDVEFIAQCVMTKGFPDPSEFRISDFQPDENEAWDDFFRLTRASKRSLDGENTPREALDGENIPTEVLDDENIPREVLDGENIPREAHDAHSSTGENAAAGDGRWISVVDIESLKETQNEQPVDLTSPCEFPPQRLAIPKKRGRGAAFTEKEEKTMVKYLASKNRISEASSSTAVWQDMIDSGLCPNRTANSLYCHFRKRVLHKIQYYRRSVGLTELQMTKFNKLKDN